MGAPMLLGTCGPPPPVSRGRPYDRGMAVPSSAAAELSSAASLLSDLTRRITTLATQAADREDDLVAGELYEVERSMAAASRRLERLIRNAPTAP